MSKTILLSRVTINDVAAYAGVSIATVSRVINKTDPVAAKTAERVRAAILELDYTPHAAARGLASRKTKTLGLLLPDIIDPFLSILLRGIAACATENGYALLIYASQGQLKRDSVDFSLPLNEGNTDGLIVFTESLDEAELTRLHRRQFPMVLLHKSPPVGANIPCVTFENKEGARKLVEHLITAHNYRRIAFLAGPKGNEDSYWREMGYREALEIHGIPFDPALVAPGNFDDEVAGATVEQWLKEGMAFDAIFAADDNSATGTIAALRRAGKRIPEDVAVAGFDDVFLSHHLTPPLTTVRAPIEKSGQKAAEQLIQLIHTGQASSLTLLPTELVIRHSCGC
jgi:DNA-binding LacI/PurR family transcriptional regulator